MIFPNRNERARLKKLFSDVFLYFLNRLSINKEGPSFSLKRPLFFCRTRDEVQEIRQTRDPILGFKEKIVAEGLTDAEELKKMELDIRKSVDADVKKAKTDPEIGIEQLYYDVYEENLQGKLRGLLPWELHEHKKTQKAINV